MCMRKRRSRTRLREPRAPNDDGAKKEVAKVPKRFLPGEIPWMDGVHQKMRGRGKAVLASRQSR